MFVQRASPDHLYNHHIIKMRYIFTYKTMTLALYNLIKSREEKQKNSTQRRVFCEATNEWGSSTQILNGIILNWRCKMKTTQWKKKKEQTRRIRKKRTKVVQIANFLILQAVTSNDIKIKLISNVPQCVGAFDQMLSLCVRVSGAGVLAYHYHET